MATVLVSYRDTLLFTLDKNTELFESSPKATCLVHLVTTDQGLGALLYNINDKQLLLKIKLNKDIEAITVDMKSFSHRLRMAKSDSETSRNGPDSSIFDQRTDETSASQYFQIILDVGAGSGILSFFAVQAGARKVYAVEASSMVEHCKILVASNQMSNRIVVMPGKIEEIDLPEQVDVIISEPMGYMLFNERMLETYLHAKKWLKPGGKMFPTRGDLHVGPFTDEALFMEQFSKANFWYNQYFHGVDLTSLRDPAIEEYFKQPIVDTFDIRIMTARTQKYTVDFLRAEERDLYTIEMPLRFDVTTTASVHGLAFWFDVAFAGSVQTVWLSTAPTQPLTHWYQVRCLLPQPLFCKVGQVLVGKLLLTCNRRQSYDVEIKLSIAGQPSQVSSNVLDLKNPCFRYTGQPPPPPPGTNNESPTDVYWNSMNNNAVDMLNGETTAAAGGGAMTMPVGGTGGGAMMHPMQQAQVQQQQVSPSTMLPIAPISPGCMPPLSRSSPTLRQNPQYNLTGTTPSPMVVTDYTNNAIPMGGMMVSMPIDPPAHHKGQHSHQHHHH